MSTALIPNRTPYRIAQTFIGRARRGDDLVARRMTEAYGPILDRLTTARNEFVRRLERAPEGLTPEALAVKARLDTYIEHATRAHTRWAGIADGHVTKAIRDATGLGVKYGAATTDVNVFRMLDRFPDETVWAMVANVSPSTPIEELEAIRRKAGATYDPEMMRKLAAHIDPRTGDLLGGLPVARTLADAAGPLARDAGTRLVVGVAMGRNPRDVARELATFDRVPLNRALTIARTESLRAYREASRGVWIAENNVNPGAVTGWVWQATLDSRTCASCLAQHGSRHPVDDYLASHPNCRCAMLPWSDRMSALTDYPQDGDAAHWLRNAPPATRRAVLGRNGARAFDRGDVELGDFVRRRESAIWGRSTTQAPLREAIQNARLAGRGPRTAPTSGSIRERAEFAGFRPDVTRVPGGITDNELHRQITDALDSMDHILRLPDGWDTVTWVRGEPNAEVWGSTAIVGDGRSINFRGLIRVSSSDRIAWHERKMTTYHEFGHYMDLMAGRDHGPRPGFFSESPDADDVFGEFFREAFTTKPIMELMDRDRGGDPYAKYALQGREVWARAFAEWMIEATDGDVTRAAATKAMASTHWDGEEWERLRPTIRAALVKLGVLK